MFEEQEGQWIASQYITYFVNTMALCTTNALLIYSMQYIRRSLTVHNAMNTDKPLTIKLFFFVIAETSTSGIFWTRFEAIRLNTSTCITNLNKIKNSLYFKVLLVGENFVKSNFARILTCQNKILSN